MVLYWILVQIINNIMHNLFAFLFFTFLSICVSAQKNNQISDTSEIKKEIKMTIENGQKVLTIETTENKNGQATFSKEVFYGVNADKKLEELKKEQLNSENSTEVKSEVWDDVRYEEVDGYKKLTVIHNENGIATEKIYIGSEAEAKLKELQEKRE